MLGRGEINFRRRSGVARVRRGARIIHRVNGALSAATVMAGELANEISRAAVATFKYTLAGLVWLNDTAGLMVTSWAW